MNQNEFTKKTLRALISADMKEELDETYRRGELTSFSVFIETIIELGLREYRR